MGHGSQVGTQEILLLMTMVQLYILMMSVVETDVNTLTTLLMVEMLIETTQ